MASMANIMGWTKMLILSPKFRYNLPSLTGLLKPIRKTFTEYYSVKQFVKVVACLQWVPTIIRLTIREEIKNRAAQSGSPNSIERSELWFHIVCALFDCSVFGFEFEFAIYTHWWIPTIELFAVYYTPNRNGMNLIKEYILWQYAM